MVIDQIPLVVPWLGESITEAVVGRWLKGVGEPVQADEAIVDLETDKVNVQVSCPQPGVLTEQMVPAGQTVRVGQTLGTVAAKSPERVASPPPAAAGPPAPPPTPIPPQPILHVASGVQVVAQAPAPPVPAARAPAAAPGDGPRLPPSKRRAALRHSSSAVPLATEAAQPAGTQEPAPKPGTTTPSTGVTTASAPSPGAKTQLGLAPLPAAGDRVEEIVPMTPLRKRIAERLVMAQHSAAALTTFNEIDMSRVLELRERFGADFQTKHGVKLGFMSFFTRAVTQALGEFPGLNAEIRGDAIVYKRFYDIGIAVGTGKGLVVPVIRDADLLGFADLEREIAEYGAKAKASKLTLEDLAGGTFTITNGGVFGSLMSTPLLNPPQTGILGMHAIVKRPIAVGDEIQIRPMMYVAVTYDHRVVDGRESVQFLMAVKRRIEDPERLMFEF
jgi:2-oxoglutarate dehydrogenase E2 component (dihydrolipoamide succinyltransferase)